MGISHIKSSPVADMTGTVTGFNSQGSTTTLNATDLVRPSDWNSIHNLTYNLAGNTSNTSQVAGTDVVWAGGNNVTLFGTGSTISINGQPPPITLSSWAPYEVPGLGTTGLSVGTATNVTLSLWPITIDDYVAAAAINLVGSWSFQSSTTGSGRQTAGMHLGLYTRGTGTNNTTMSLLDSASFSWGVTGNSVSYTISYPASTDGAAYTYSTTSSNATNVASLFTGLKLMQFPIGQTLAPGVYWVGIMGSASTSSQNKGFSVSVLGASTAALTALAPLNAHTSNYTTGTGFAAAGGVGGPWGFGHGSWSSANQTNMPNTVAYSAMSAAPVVIPFMKFWSTS